MTTPHAVSPARPRPNCVASWAIGAAGHSEEPTMHPTTDNLCALIEHSPSVMARARAHGVGAAYVAATVIEGLADAKTKQEQDHMMGVVTRCCGLYGINSLA